MKKEYEFNWIAWFFAIITTIVLICCAINFDSSNAVTFVFVMAIPTIFDIFFIRECILQIKYMINKKK